MRIPCLYVDYPQEEKEERRRMCVPCNSATHLFPLLGWWYYLVGLCLDICWVCCFIVMAIYMDF
jgi:hypothetical protein